jgi:TRAP-type mannitol/chloroaromatic compound transport system substrate-binding protein
MTQGEEYHVKRRQFISTGAIGMAGAAAAATLAAPAIAQTVYEWRMVNSWPKNLPGVGAGAERLAERITKASGGRLKITPFAAGELVPALQCMDAVMDGTAEMGHDASFYHVGKHPAFAIFFAVPFGMNADEQFAWMRFGGGQALWDELNDQFGIVSFMAGQTACQSFGWFKKEITSMQDFVGLKMRIPGLGGQLLGKVGGSAVLMPAGEIFAGLQSGAIDAAEFIGPLNDLALGFHQVAKYCYGPGIQEPGGNVQLMVNKAKYMELPEDLQQIIASCAAEGYIDMKSEYDIRSGEAMEVLANEHGVQFMRLPNEVLVGLGKAAGELVAESMASGDDITKRVWDSYLKARSMTMRTLRFNEQAFLNARTLEFDFPAKM